MKYSKITYAKIPTDPVKLEKFYKKNCEKLIDIMLRLRPEQHDQRTYSSETECGTACCALGWAAYSNEFPGLQTARTTHPWRDVVVNGKRGEWWTAGQIFFGAPVESYVFASTNISKKGVIRRLREYIQTGRVSCWDSDYDAD